MSNPNAYYYYDPYRNPTATSTPGATALPQNAVLTSPTATTVYPTVYATTPTVAYATPGVVYTTQPTTMVGTGVGSALSREVPVGNKVVDKMPNQQQIERTLERVREQVHIAKHETEGLNPMGERILNDTERLVESAALFMREKNEGDKIQRLAQESYLAQRELSSHAHGSRDWEVLEGFDSERLRSLALETLQTARMAGLEIARSRRFRAQVRALINLFSEAISSEQHLDSSSDEYGADRSSTDRMPAAAQQPYHAAPLAHGEAEIPVGATGVHQRVEGLSHRLEKGLKIGGNRRLRLNQDQMDQLSQRFVELLRDITSRQSTADLMRRVLDIFRLFEEEIDADKRGQVTGGLRSVADSEHLRRSLALAQEIFETFTGNRTLDPLLGHLRAIGHILRTDEEARRYFHSLRTFFRSILDNPNRLSERQTVDELKQLIRWAQDIHEEKLYEHLSGSLGEAKLILRQVERDPATVRLKNDAKALLSDMMLDEQGNVVLKTEALEQLRLIIIQSLVERVRIPIPAIHIDNPDMQLRLSNIVVTLRDLIPDSVIMSNSGRMAVNLTSLKEGIDTSSHGQELVFEIRNVNLFIEDADIWFKRNKFPRVEDEGKIRISIGGSGVDLKIILRTFIRAKDIIEVDRVICDVHNMKLHLYETRHNFLYNAVAKVLKGRIKRNIEHSVENNVADYIMRLNRILTKQIAAARTRGGTLGPISGLKNRIVTPGTSAASSYPSTTAGTLRPSV